MRRKKTQDNKDWLDWWLSDEAPTPEIAAKLNDNPIGPADEDIMEDAQPLTASFPEDSNVTVVVKIPQIDKASFNKAGSVVKNRQFLAISAFALIMMMSGLAVHSYVFKPSRSLSESGNQQVFGSNTQTGQSAINSISIPLTSGSNKNSQNGSNVPYATVSPAARYLPGNYNNGTGIYSYNDGILGTTINVSEQPLPKIYKSPAEAITQLAAAMGPSQVIQTSNGQAYVHTEQGSGEQTVIFSMNGLYIYINSSATYSNEVWKAYIKTLS